MIDSTNNNNGTNGLATALRDRSTCTIPVQPNRSLPVRPAPHTPCRSLLSKKTTKKSDTDQTQNELLPNSTQNSDKSSATSALSVVLTPVNINSQLSSSSSSSSTSSSSSSLSSSRSTNNSHNKINGENWQNKTCLPIINTVGVANKKKINEKNNEKTGNAVGRLSTKRKLNNDVVNNGNFDNNYNMNNNCNFIDITKSPERYHEFSINIDSSSSSCSKNDSIILDDDDDRGTNTTAKKRRRRKDKKSTNNNVSSIKIVPPLRLKKIQCLQEDNATNCVTDNWSHVQQSVNVTQEQQLTDDIGFRYYQPELSPRKQIVRGDTPTADDWSNKYRIVIDHTPAYTIDIHDPATIISDNGDEKLRYRQHKLQLKLCELKKKTVELGREMLRTAFTSPNNSMQETIDSYEKQIETLKNLITKLPETNNDDITVRIPGSPIPSTIVSSSSFMTTTSHTSTSPYCDSSQSPGPPKLSPKITIDSKIINGTCEMRNSPPVLPKINMNNNDNCIHWSESEFPKQISNTMNEQACSAGVSTTSECLIDEEIDIDDKPELLEFTLNEIIESDSNTNVITQNDNVNTRGPNENTREMGTENPSAYTNSDGIMINTSNSVIQELKKHNDRITSPKITSSCDASQNSHTNQSTISKSKIAAAKTVDDMIRSNQFPSLSKWLANSHTAKKFLSSSALGRKDSTNSIPSENSSSINQHTTNEQFNQAQKLNIPSDTSRNKNILDQNSDVSATQWNNEQWQNQTHRQLRTTQNAPANNVNIAIGPPQFCAPVPVTGVYARNYPFQMQMDSCGPYNYTHPAIAASTNAVSAASVWNNTVLQYPLIRPQSILNSQLSGIKTNINTPLQHSVPVSATNSVPIQNASISSYHLSPTTSSQENVAKRLPINDPINLKVPLTNYAKRNDYAPSTSTHPHILPESSNSTGIQQLSQQQQAQQQQVQQQQVQQQQVRQVQQQQVQQQQVQQQQVQQQQVQQQQQQQQQQHQQQQQQQQEDYYRYYRHQALLQRQAVQASSSQQQQQHQQHQTVQYADGFGESTNPLAIHDRSMAQMNYRPPWRGPMTPTAPFVPVRNYGLRNNWTMDPCNLLSTLSPVALQNYTSPLNMGMPIGIRTAKEHVDQTRNCDTPHLGKVEYSANASRTLKCSNCGRSGPTFKCLGCEMTFYCDKTCQARHWDRHVITCPKKMPKLQKVLP